MGARMKRAISLGGGGPAAGLHLGALKAFHDHDMTFDVWALSCIGVWVAAIYNSFESETAPRETEAYFREHYFRDDVTYSRFPIAPPFIPDLQGGFNALSKFMTDPSSYENLFAPDAIQKATEHYIQFVSDPSYWNPNAFNELMSDIAAANPLTRYMVSMMWLSNMNGLTGGSHKGPSLSTSFDFEQIYRPDKPFLYHNAWNLAKDKIQLFANRKQPPPHMKSMTKQSMGACSALPFIIQTTEIDGDPYCEGALVRTVDFSDLLEAHPELEEVWIVRIVDPRQVRPQKNLYDAMNNLCMLFAGALGEANVQEFEDKVNQKRGKKNRVRIYPIEVSHDINYDWTRSNLQNGIDQGYMFAEQEIKKYLAD